MVNWDKNIQGAAWEQRRKAYEEKQRAKEAKVKARLDEHKAKQAEAQRRNLEAIVTDLNKSEEEAYLPVFDVLSSSGPVSPTDPALLKFVVKHTDISVDDSLETLVEALKQVSPGEDEPLSFNDFMQLLRDNAASDSSVIASFLEAGNGMDFVALAIAKAHLLHLGQSKVKTSLSKDNWDTILDAVLSNSESTLGLQDYIKHSRAVSRSARLLQYLQDEALVMMQGESEDKELLEAGSQDEKYWVAISEKVSSVLSGKGLPCPVVVVRKQRSSNGTKEAALSSSKGMNHESAAGCRDDQADDGLPAVARRCALCINCQGLCETHAKFARRRATARAAAPSDPEADSGGPQSSAVPSSSSTSGVASDSRPSSSSGTAVPKCDLCKASGGVCEYHARARRKQAASTASGSTSSGSRPTSGLSVSSGGGSSSSSSSWGGGGSSGSSGSSGGGSGCSSSSGGGNGGFTGCGSSDCGGGSGGGGSSGSGGGGGASGGSSGSSPVLAARGPRARDGAPGSALADASGVSLHPGEVPRSSLGPVAGRRESRTGPHSASAANCSRHGCPSGIGVGADSLREDDLPRESSREAAPQVQTPAQPPDPLHQKQKAARSTKKAKKKGADAALVRKAKLELEAALAAQDPSRLEDAILAGADAGMDEEELLPAFEVMEALLGR